ncbi:MAG: TolC family protein [Bacteroidota bacterium]
MKKNIFISVVMAVVAGMAHGQQEKTLDYFVRQALANSPLLKDYRNQVLINQADSLRIRAAYGPQVNGTSNSYYAPVILGYGYDGAITNGGQLSALAGYSQALINKKYLAAQFETLRLQSQGIDNTAKVSEQDLTRTITAQYITAFGDLQQLGFAKEINALLRKEEGLLKTLTESNVYRQTDYLTFLVTRQQQELSIKQLTIQLQNDYATLNYLSGVFDTSAVVLTEPPIELNKLPEINESIFFKKFVIDSLTLRNSQALVNYSYKPKVNLFADAGYSSTLTYLPYKNFGTSAGVSISVPIFDGHQRKIQYSKIAVAERTRLSYQDFFTTQYSQQIAQLSQQLKATGELIAQINNQVKYAEGLINVNMKLLETGDAKIADLVIAVNNYLAAKNLLTQNNVSRLLIINQINYWNR